MTSVTAQPLQPLLSPEPLIGFVGEDPRRHFAWTPAEPSETRGDAADWAPGTGHLSLLCPYNWAIFSGQDCVQPAHYRDTAKSASFQSDVMMALTAMQGACRTVSPASQMTSGPSLHRDRQLSQKLPMSLMSLMSLMSRIAKLMELRLVRRVCDVSKPLQVSTKSTSSLVARSNEYPDHPLDISWEPKPWRHQSARMLLITSSNFFTGASIMTLDRHATNRSGRANTHPCSSTSRRRAQSKYTSS